MLNITMCFHGITIITGIKGGIIGITGGITGITSRMDTLSTARNVYCRHYRYHRYQEKSENQKSCRISSLLYDDVVTVCLRAHQRLLYFPHLASSCLWQPFNAAALCPLTRTHTHPYTCICIFSVICICICSLYSFLQHCNAAFYKATKSFSFFSKLRYLYICHSICICI